MATHVVMHDAVKLLQDKGFELVEYGEQLTHRFGRPMTLQVGNQQQPVSHCRVQMFLPPLECRLGPRR